MYDLETEIAILISTFIQKSTIRSLIKIIVILIFAIIGSLEYIYAVLRIAFFILNEQFLLLEECG